MTTLISVIIPTYRRPQQLRACLVALAAQSLTEPWELIVVDDGSPTPIDALELSRAGLLPARWRVIRQPNAGPAAARNRGADAAVGRLLAFTDDDCCPEPTWLETMVQAARDRPGALIGGTTINGVEGDLFASTSQWIVEKVYAYFNKDPDNAYFIASNNMACSRKQFHAIRGFDEAFRQASEDRDFCDRWRVEGWPIAWTQAALVSHHHHQNCLRFLGLHYRYGQGAFAYHSSRRKRRSGRLMTELGFHRELPRQIKLLLGQCHSRSRSIKVMAAVAAWQMANAAGFMVASFSSKQKLNASHRG